jgi:hypothetical protein
MQRRCKLRFHGADGSRPRLRTHALNIAVCPPFRAHFHASGAPRTPKLDGLMVNAGESGIQPQAERRWGIMIPKPVYPAQPARSMLAGEFDARVALSGRTGIYKCGAWQVGHGRWGTETNRQ